MNYYYEIKLNFNDTSYRFYEWNKNDKLEHIKKIPLLKINTKTLKKIFTNNFKIDTDIMKYISDKTICKNNYTIRNACIFCDTKNCIAIEFDDAGNSIARSELLLEDENNICEIAYSFKYCNLDITNLKSISIRNEFRQEYEIKKIINKEILELYHSDNNLKLEYLYYEWFDSIEKNKDVMLENMTNDLKKDITDRHYKIYSIIKMSYSKNEESL